MMAAGNRCPVHEDHMPIAHRDDLPGRGRPGSAAAARITADQDTARLVSAYLNVRVSLRQPAFVSLRVDSLGLNEWGADSLRPPARVAESFRVRCETNPVLGLEYSRSAQTDTHPGGWRLEVSERSVRLLSRWSEAEKPEALALEFDPHRCHVTLLGLFNQDGSIRLPAVMHFPDQGSFRITSGRGRGPGAGLRCAPDETGVHQSDVPALDAGPPSN